MLFYFYLALNRIIIIKTRCSSYILNLPLAESVHDSGEDDQENTTSRTETKNLGAISIYTASFL